MNEYMNGPMSDNITEERPAKKKRRKRNVLSSVLIMLCCLIILVLLTVLAGMAYMWIDGKVHEEDSAVAINLEDLNLQSANGQNTNGGTENGQVSNGDVSNGEITGGGAATPEPVTYTQAELDARIEEAVAIARQEASDDILNGIKETLSTGEVTTVEMLRPYYENDLVVVSNGKFNFVPIREDLKKNDYVEENLQFLESGEYQYVEDGRVTSYKGIDVSKFQGVIDWEAVAEDGVEFAFIRVGNRGYGTEGKLLEDELFEENVEGAQKAGIKVGVYFYTQAVNEEELREEAELVLEKIAPYNIECPIVYDVEKVSSANGRMNALSVEERTNLTLMFCQIMEEAGYKPMIYFNLEMSALMLDMDALEDYDKWLAYYNPEFYYPYAYKVWQYTDKGRVNGIEGEVDMNISFEPLWE